MPGDEAYAASSPQADPLKIVAVASFSRLRVLAWRDDVLYAARGYSLLQAKMNSDAIEWQPVARFEPAWWRNLSVVSRPTFRMFRDGFHALAILGSGHMVGAVPGAIVSLAPGEEEFRLTHRVLRGNRPLHITAAPNDHLSWGEYFQNPARDEVHIYVSTDRGARWDVAYTFPRGAVRHVHNIVYDEWTKCLWVLTGDNGSECRILRASCDFRNVDVVLSGHQQARAVALVPMPDGLYFSSDTPLEANHVYRLDRGGTLTELAPLSSSSIYACRAGAGIFFSTMVEPSPINLDRNVRLYGSGDGHYWQDLSQWQKDFWPMSLFQYGNAFLPDGRNTTNYLAVTTVAVQRDDLKTSIWRVLPAGVL
jgi:hypothetical protein